MKPSKDLDENGHEYLNKITTTILENLKDIDFAPSVQMTDISPALPGTDTDVEDELDDEDEDEHNDDRYTQRRRDKLIADEDGYVSESEDEGEVLRRSKRRNIADSVASTSDRGSLRNADDQTDDDEEDKNKKVDGIMSRLSVEDELALANDSEAADEPWEDVARHIEEVKLRVKKRLIAKSFKDPGRRSQEADLLKGDETGSTASVETPQSPGS